jgi:hypothetical protein
LVGRRNWRRSIVILTSPGQVARARLVLSGIWAPPSAVPALKQREREDWKNGKAKGLSSGVAADARKGR